MDDKTLIKNLREEISILHKIIQGSEKQIVKQEEIIRIFGGLVNKQRDLILTYKEGT